MFVKVNPYNVSSGKGEMRQYYTSPIIIITTRPSKLQFITVLL